jgi:hypothetical protein
MSNAKVQMTNQIQSSNINEIAKSLMLLSSVISAQAGIQSS